MKLAGALCPRRTVLNIRRQSIASSLNHLSANPKMSQVHAIAWTTSLRPISNNRTTSTSMAIFMHGIDTSRGLMNKYSEMNVGIKEHNRTGTGQYLPMIRESLPSLTEAKLPWEGTERLYFMVQRCFQPSANSSLSHPELVADVSRRGLFPISRYVAEFFQFILSSISSFQPTELKYTTR
jgi:hypothetical protein